MFGLVLLLAVTFMHLYVFWRASSITPLKRLISQRYFVAAGAVLWAVFLLSRFYGHGGTGLMARTLELTGMSWMSVLFLITVCLLAVDLLTVFGLIFSGHARSLRGWALIAGLALSLIALVQGLRSPVVQEYEVRLTGLPPGLDGKVIVAMSDLHAGGTTGRKWLADRISQVHAERPDLIVLLGDIFEGHGEPEKEMVQTLHGLSAPLGVWAVLGNHEYYGRERTGRYPMEIDGVRVLRNSWVEVMPGLVLAGVDDLTANHLSGLGGDPVSKALEGRPAGATVLLSHTPWQAEKAAQYGAGLMLSGHTHGGQIWPFGYLVKQVYPLLAGRYNVNGTTVIVCRGTGLWGPRMRLWHTGEIMRVTIRA